MSKEITIQYDNTTNPSNDHTHQIFITDKENNTDYSFRVEGCNHADLDKIPDEQLLALGRTQAEDN